MWIKICGITRLEDAIAAARFGADAVGFVFADSPRRVSPERAREISISIPRGVLRVGVFVDSPPEEISRIAGQCGLDAVQLHGEEGAEYPRMLDREVIKAFRVDLLTDVFEAASYPCDKLLFDGYQGSNNGGFGFDWREIGLVPPSKKVVVAGGLNPGNVGRVIEGLRPYGVDVSSGVESEPGVKDPVLIYRFIESARLVDYEVNGS